MESKYTKEWKGTKERKDQGKVGLQGKEGYKKKWLQGKEGCKGQETYRRKEGNQGHQRKEWL